MNSIDNLIQELWEYAGVGVFLEYYSHTDKIMYKVLNPWTEYHEDKLVLSPMEEGIEKALCIALPKLAQCKENYLNSKKINA